MASSDSIREVEAFYSTPRKHGKPTVRLRDVAIYTQTSRPILADLFDALFKGPFSATGVCEPGAESKIKCKHQSAFTIRVQDVDKFAIEENDQTSPPTVTIYFEGAFAWYIIDSVDPSYASIFTEMQLKAQVWLWIQHKRSAALAVTHRKHWPSLRLLQRDMPIHLRSRVKDPMDTFHAYIIERLLQSNISGEALSVGPEGVQPQWMETQLAEDLQSAHPAIWRTILDRVEAVAHGAAQPLQQEALSPRSKRAQVQRPSKQARQLLEIFMTLGEDIKQTQNLSSSATIIANHYRTTGIEEISDSETLERIENHAEGLLNDTTFIQTFTDWPGIRDIRRFREHPKWWKRPYGRARPALKPHLSDLPIASSSAASSTMDISSADGSDMETPVLTQGQAKKGKSVLRPQTSMSMTPGTPTRELKREGSATSDMLSGFVDLTNDDDELQLSEIPPNVSKKIPLGKPSRKRKLAIYSDDSSTTSKRSRRQENAPLANGIEFGRGRPPLISVKIPSTNNDFIFRCPFPSCSYNRVCPTSKAAKAEIDKHHHTHRNEIREALQMLKDPFIVGGRVGGEKGNRLIRPLGAIDHLIERIEEMAKGLGSTPSRRVAV